MRKRWQDPPIRAKGAKPLTPIPPCSERLGVDWCERPSQHFRDKPLGPILPKARSLVANAKAVKKNLSSAPVALWNLWKLRPRFHDEVASAKSRLAASASDKGLRNLAPTIPRPSRDVEPKRACAALGGGIAGSRAAAAAAAAKAPSAPAGRWGPRISSRQQTECSDRRRACMSRTGFPGTKAGR